MVKKKESKTTRTVSDVPLTEHQPPNKCIIEDESIVWLLLRLLEVGEDNEEDGTGIEPPTWNQFYEVMVDEMKSPTTVRYEPMYPRSSSDKFKCSPSISKLFYVTYKLFRSGDNSYHW